MNIFVETLEGNLLSLTWATNIYVTSGNNKTPARIMVARPGLDLPIYEGTKEECQEVLVEFKRVLAEHNLFLSIKKKGEE